MNATELAGAAIDKLLELAVDVVAPEAIEALRRLKPTAVEQINISARTVRIVDKRTRPTRGG